MLFISLYKLQQNKTNTTHIYRKRQTFISEDKNQNPSDDQMI